MAVCLSHTSLFGYRTHLPCLLLVEGRRLFPVFTGCRFALREAFPRSLVGRDSHDYDQGSVTMALASCRPSPGTSLSSV